MTPDLRAISRPWCTSISVGMLWMENRRSSSCTASLSTLTSRKSGSSWVAACSKIGAIARQGPHQIAQKSTNSGIREHKARVTVFVPHYAMSGGTLIALAADEIVMCEHSVLGPIDPQLGESPAASLIKVVEQKPMAKSTIKR